MSLFVNICHEFNICHYWYFLNTWLKFQSNICVKCHDLLMKSMNFSDAAIVNTVEKLLYSQGTFSLSRDFSTVKKLFYSEGTFSQTRKCSANRKVFHTNFSLIKEVFHKQRFLHSQKNFCKHRKRGCHFSHTQDSKRFQTPKIIYTQKTLPNTFQHIIPLGDIKNQTFKGCRKRPLKLIVLIDKVLKICYFFD